MAQHSQFALLKTRRFLPFFLTQASGALNDNVFKNALAVLIAFQGSQLGSLNTDQVINLSAGLFILPFFLFSAMVGQFADKLEKSRQIRHIKMLEIVIMLTAALGFYLGNVTLLLLVLFMLGLQSTLFSPVKFSLMPQVLKPDELVGGNGLVETGTFVSILLGTALGAYFVAIPDTGIWIITGICLSVAVAGYLASRFIPELPATDPGLKINWNPFSETWQILSRLAENRTLLNSVLGMSWFWFFGATVLVQIPSFTINVLGGSSGVTAGILTMFIIGISTGSLLCHKLSGGRVEIGLVPLGAVGMTLFGADLFFASPSAPLGVELSLGAFLSIPAVWRILLDMVMLGIFGGFFIVPLFALVQHRSPPERRARVIAANSIINALFMVIAALMALILLGNGFSIPQLFLITAILNALVSVYIFTLVPEFTLRFMAWIGTNLIYQLRVRGLENIPADGPALLVCNHISYMDPPILAGAVPRPVCFVTYHRIYKTPLLKWVFRSARAIPIAPGKEDPVVMERAFEGIDKRLAEGEIVGIFPEGRLTPDGSIQPFRSGVERILEQRQVPVIPVAIQGLWGSLFSRQDKGLNKRPRKFLKQINVTIGEPVEPQLASSEYLQARVQALHDAAGTSGAAD